MNRNLGQNRLRRKRRSGDPMEAYDALPAPLRRWLSQAVLPWSPKSVRQIWQRSLAKGLTLEEALHSLNQAEIRTLASEKRRYLNYPG